MIRGEKMKRKLFLLVTLALLVGSGVSSADDADLKKELDALKQRVQELEVQLETQETRQTVVAQQPEEAEGSPVEGEEWEAVKNTFAERFGTLSIHGGVLGYYQGRNAPDIGGIGYDNANGAGFVADLELTFKPFEDGEFLMHIHAGEGQGSDKDLADDGALFANLNTIADDNPGDDGVSVLQAFYTHTFSERFFVSVGKTEQVAFIDDNAFANDEYVQFVGKPFVDNPMLDSEDEFGPLLAVGAVPADKLSLVLLYGSSSHPRLEEDVQKDIWDDIFDHPFFGGQITYSPEWNGLAGNYRLYGWGATYPHPVLTGEDTERGWGVGLSLDQKVHEQVGLFARFAYSNEDVYEVPWFWSAGVNLLGLIVSRDEDEIGIGVAGLRANDDLEHTGTEYHMEAYYRIALSESFSITPDIQYVVNPLGNTDNDNIIAGMIKGQFTF